MRQYPGTFSIYKKLGAAQFTIINPKINESGRIDKNGAILLEAASGTGERKYEWSNKITFALGMSDICNLFENPDSPPKLIHSSPNSSAIKNLELVPGEGKYVGTFMLKLGQKDSESSNFNAVSVPISAGEYTVLLRLLMAAAPSLIGWD